MRPVMTVMGSLLLAGNLLLALPVRPNTLLVRNAEQAEQEVRSGIADILTQKGMEAASAAHLVTERYGRYDRKLAQAFTHLQLLFPELKRETLLAYMAERILHNEAFAFDDYDHLVAMLHRLEGVDLSAAHYDRVRQCALLNRSLFRA
jgi:hypothetical protein